MKDLKNASRMRHYALSRKKFGKSKPREGKRDCLKNSVKTEKGCISGYLALGKSPQVRGLEA